jgi:hypothetical protein
MRRDRSVPGLGSCTSSSLASGHAPAHPAPTPSRPARRPGPARRVAPAAGLFLLAPLVGEYLGNVSITEIGALPVLALLYGSGAILVREVARRTGRGWPTMLVLGLAVTGALYLIGAVLVFRIMHAESGGLLAPAPMLAAVAVVLCQAATGFLLTQLYGREGAIHVLGNLVFALGAVGLLLAAVRATRRGAVP